MRPLTARQADVGRLVAAGLTTRQIADRLGISEFTVAAHIRDAAAALPGTGRPRYRVLRHFLERDDDGDAA